MGYTHFVALVAGTRLGPYEILSVIGAGGMGEVYRARDSRLNRLVAIKILPPHLSENPELRQRFEREARTISSLSHPHICTLHDVGRQDGIDFLVMEYLEGQTLADRLRNGALSLDLILRHGIQIADALDQAHRHGIIHRDLKPGNIMLTERGAKLLDFGLAKLRTDQSNAFDLSDLSTQEGLTVEGRILGTIPYMAPEQLEGKQVDSRTDIFALGAVLYEMTTGRRAFSGQSQASLMAAILSSNPLAISSIQSNVPKSLDRLIQRCLAKNPEDRWQSARDIMLELKWIAEEKADLTLPKARISRAWLLAGFAFLSMITVILAFLTFRKPQTNEGAVRFYVSLPEKTYFTPDVICHNLSISPDGRKLALVATSLGRTQLWVRMLDSLSAQPLAGTEGVRSPFWSPDSRFIGFFADGKLKKIEAIGGPVQTICNSATGTATWGPHDTILFSSNEYQSPIYRVSGTGGTPTQVVKPDPSRDEIALYWPQFLPDGHHFLFVLQSTKPHGVIKVGSLDSSETKVVLSVNSRVVYAPPGFLMYVKEGTLLAQPFEARTLQVRGEAFPIAERLPFFAITGSGDFSVSQNGVLSYQAGTVSGKLVWFNRKGEPIGSIEEPNWYTSLRLSPDDQKVIASIADYRSGLEDCWLYEFSRNSLTRFTSDPGSEGNPVWSPNGKEAVLAFDPGTGIVRLYRKSLAAGSTIESLPAPGDFQIPHDWSADGRFVLYTAFTGTNSDLWVLPMYGNQKPFALLQSSFDESDARFSPDGNWIAYVSNESGQPDVYVRSFPGSGEQWKISPAGGSQPKWRRDGKELFYIAADNYLMSVPVTTLAPFVYESPVKLFKIESAVSNRVESSVWNDYDVASDGQRFLINTGAGGVPALPITVVLNWTRLVTK